MTLMELEDQFPNGFHVAMLVGRAVDFATGTCRLDLDLDCDDPVPNVFLRRKIKLSGVSLVILDPPDVREGTMNA